VTFHPSSSDLRPLLTLTLTGHSEGGSFAYRPNLTLPKIFAYHQLAQHSWANVYKVQASSFVERVNSAGKIVFNDTNLKMKPDKVEKRVTLRMNRKWIAHMKTTYPHVTPEMMTLMRQSHEALNMVRDQLGVE
jgi:hypothetical protein